MSGRPFKLIDVTPGTYEPVVTGEILIPENAREIIGPPGWYGCGWIDEDGKQHRAWRDDMGTQGHKVLRWPFTCPRCAKLNAICDDHGFGK